MEQLQLQLSNNTIDLMAIQVLGYSLQYTFQTMLEGAPYED